MSRAQAVENRQRVIDTASRLFREHGFNGIGLVDLMKGAGLTQGAFYKQFKSKEDLAAQACERALEEAVGLWSGGAAGDAAHPLDALVDAYLSPGHREEVARGCPIVALGSDATRQGPAVRATLEAGIRARLDLLGDAAAATDGTDTRRRAMAVLSTLVGALLLSRIVEDEVLSDGFLEAAAASLHRGAQA